MKVCWGISAGRITGKVPRLDTTGPEARGTTLSSFHLSYSIEHSGSQNMPKTKPSTLTLP